ncbi:MAG: hypothetical protein PUF56_05550 [Lachnospiraceae bacterium]|nr:hypothetical protein [Lachnospiraceae bacterium]
MTRYKIKNRIRNKIKSEQGASLMIALLFFLVCAVVGSVVLTGATVTSRRTSGPDTDANRRRYALISARDLITEQMKSGISSQNGSNQSESDQSGSQVNQSGNSGAASDGESSVSFEQSWDFTLVEQDDGSTSLSSSKDNAYVPQTFQPKPIKDTSSTNSDPLFTSLRKNMTEKVIAYYWPYFTCGKKATTQASSEVPPANSPDLDPWQTEFPITDWDQVLNGANGSGSTGSGTSSSGESDTALANKYTVQTTKDGGPLEINLDSDKNFPTVYADVCMDSSFQIKIHLYCKENSGNSSNSSNSGNSGKTASDANRPELWILYPLSDVSITYNTSPKSENSSGKSVTYTRSMKIQVSWGQPLITSDENLLKTSD